MSKRTLVLLAAAMTLAATPIDAQQPTVGGSSTTFLVTLPADSADTIAIAPVAATVPVRVSGRYWRPFLLGFATSVLAHEAGHIGASLALGGRPSFGFDKARPTVYSGISANLTPRRQFLFSSAGLTVQALLDELILDIPHAGGSAFERGILAGGIGTTAFYFTLGRSGSVSDVDFMARTSSLSKTQLMLIYGGIAAMHSVRIAHDGRYANFFARPDADGRVRIGVDLR